MKKLLNNYSVFAAMGVIALVAGCAEVADPAARSNRATYTITCTASGDGAQCSAYICDGLMATADGEGAITQPSTQTQKPSTEISGGMDPIAAGIGAATKLGVAAINAASGGGDCKGGDCGEGGCSGGDCGEGACPGGDCGE